MHHALAFWIVLGLAAFNVFWNLGTTAVSSMDEARYGVAAGEMLSRGDFLVPTYAGAAEYWNLKPPLGYWLIDGAFALFGRSVWSLRVVSACAALAVIAGTMRLGRRRLGPLGVGLAGSIVATSFGFLSDHGARSGDLDAVLTLLVTLALGLALDLRNSRRARYAAAIIWGAAFLLKSFAIAPFLLATGVFLLCQPDARPAIRDLVGPALVFTAIVGAWGVLRSLHDGSVQFLWRMIHEDLLQRSSSPIDGGTYSPLAYGGALVGDRLAPWPLVALAGFWRGGPLRPSTDHGAVSDQRLWLCWAMLPLAVFSLARTQHHWYLDPSYPAFALIAAAVAESLIERASTPAARARLIVALVALLLACEWRVFYRIEYSDRRPQAQRTLLDLSRFQTPRHRLLATTFPLSHAERFLLQVADGFDVRDSPTDAQLRSMVASTSFVWILSRGRASDFVSAEVHEPDGRRTR